MMSITDSTLVVMLPGGPPGRLCSSFWARAVETYISGIWSIPRFHLSVVRPDWMHMSCLGILQYLLGNCLWEMIEALGGNHTRSRTACSRLLNMIDVCARSLGEETPINTLTVTMVRASATAKPKFKGKAVESRRFLPIVLQVLSVCFPVDTVHERNRFHCVEALHLCYKEMEDWQASTSPERLGQLARRHLLLWAEL